MPNLTDAAKRMKQSAKNRARNRNRKSALKAETRGFQEILTKGQADTATKAFSRLTQHLDQVAAKGTLHKNTVARKKSRLAKRLNAVLAKKG